MMTIEEQIALYEDGVSIRQIATRLRVPTTTISRRFKRYGVIRRSQTEAVQLGIGQTGHHGGRPRQYTVNEAFFDTLTPEVAYIIGVIQADGTISSDRFSISASTKLPSDIEHLRSLARLMESNRPLQVVRHPHGEVARLAINSERMVGALQRWGLHSPRTWTASTHPDLLLDRDYWRGVVDGDGTVVCLIQGSPHFGRGWFRSYLRAVPSLCTTSRAYQPKQRASNKTHIRRSLSRCFGTRLGGHSLQPRNHFASPKRGDLPELADINGGIACVNHRR